MSQTTISLRLDNKIHKLMKSHDEINWSAVIRKSISNYVEKFEEIDSGIANEAVIEMDNLRKLKTFSHGKKSGEIIREWRDKRK